MPSAAGDSMELHMYLHVERNHDSLLCRPSEEVSSNTNWYRDSNIVIIFRTLHPVGNCLTNIFFIISSIAVFA